MQTYVSPTPFFSPPPRKRRGVGGYYVYIFVFQNVIIDSWCPRKFQMVPPPKNDGCWDGVGHVFFWVFRSKGRAMFSLTPKNQGFGTHLKLNDTSPWLWGVVVLPVFFFLGEGCSRIRFFFYTKHLESCFFNVTRYVRKNILNMTVLVLHGEWWSPRNGVHHKDLVTWENQA